MAELKDLKRRTEIVSIYEFTVCFVVALMQFHFQQPRAVVFRVVVS